MGPKAFLDSNGITPQEFAEALPGETADARYFKAWRLLNGKQKWTQEYIDVALAWLSKRLRRDVSYEEFFAEAA